MTTIDPPQEDVPPLPSSNAPATTGNSAVPNPTYLSIPPALESIYNQVTSYPFHADQEFLAGLAAILGHPDTLAAPEELQENSDLVLQAQCFYLSRRLNIDPPIDPGKYLEWVALQERSPTPHAHAQQPAIGPHIAAAVPVASADLQSTQTKPTTEAQQLEAEPPVQSAASSQGEQHTQPTTATAPSPAVSTPPDQETEPPYPTSFAAIVDLITRNLPIPGIEDIPPTVLEPGTSKIDRTPRRRKPWEKDVDTAAPTDEEEKQEATSTDAGARKSGEPQDRHEIESSDAAKEQSINGHVRLGQDQGVVKMLQPNAIAPSGLLSND
ncbi:hypothetical protein PV04_04101 [Phialophora macrospora]|uniref:Uncharacterized protein n=1 Tax=Phialophora macrospora TaxID=1851006 RepID=A0A0D2G899_9EURO|nr:hypothetical protein PV04_04101 [Phialophora macrospora]